MTTLPESVWRERLRLRTGWRLILDYGASRRSSNGYE
jgi:hypothetical protein